MVKPALIFCLLAALGVARADVRYTLKCEMESNSKVKTLSGALEQAMKDCTTQILQTDKRQLTRNGKTTSIIDYDANSRITIDHQAKTWTRTGIAGVEQANQAAMAQLKAMGAQFKIASNLISEQREISGYRSKGLLSILDMSFSVPGMPKGMSSRTMLEIWVSDSAPGAKEIITRSGENSPTMAMMRQFITTIPGAEEMLREVSQLVGQLMEINMVMDTKGLDDTMTIKTRLSAENFDTKPIDPAEFEIPKDYKEIK